MRELERRLPAHSATTPPACDSTLPHRLAIVGAGRLGTALAVALRDGGVEVDPPLRRGQHPDPAADAVLLCVGDDEIAAAAASIDAGPLLGHCSGATGLEALGDRRAFSLHPLMTVAAGAGPDVLRGAGAAIDGSDEAALATARALAASLGLVAVRIAPEDRAAYHAAASIASNFLVTLGDAAERLGAEAGLAREQLVPLVRAAVENWATLGPERALTGPVARGDEPTVARQRAAVAQRTPELLELFDALTEATRRLAGRDRAGSRREPVAC
jgi:predicted short-subunit dehydrogenase-like oxidoreductase (DUF2520 family)